MLFKIDFTRPHLYEDVVTLNQGNLSTNNTLRCRVVTGGNDDVTGATIVCTFVINGKQVFESGKVVDGPRGVVDVVFPSDALVVGENTLEFLINRVDGSVAQSPVIKYRVWQGLTTDEGVRADNNYPLLIELIGQVNEAVVSANKALEGANNVIIQGDELKASVDKLKADCIASVDSSTKENTAKIDNAISQNISRVDATIAKNEASIVKANAAAEKAILAANNSDTKTAENIKNVNAAIAAGTQDLEVKAARVDMDGKEHGSLKERLESDLKKGKVIEETRQGAYLSFNDTIEGLVSDIEVLGNTVQDASNLANIKSSCAPNGDGTFKMSILSVGENLFDGKVEIGGINNANGLNANVTDYVRSVDFIPVNKNTSYICKNHGYDRRIYSVYFYRSDKTYISYKDLTSVGESFTTPNDCKFVRFVVWESSPNLSNYSKIKLQEGTVATPYTPYEENRCDIKLPCQLEKWDKLYFDKEENAWVVDKWTLEYSPRNQHYTINALNNVYRCFPSNATLENAEYKNDYGKATTICKGLPFIQDNYFARDEEHYYIDPNAKKEYLFFNKNKFDGTSEGLNKYFESIDFYMLIKLASPQKIVLPQSEQIKLNSFANKTHIYTISGEVDATVKATVSKSLASTVQANTEEISKINNAIADMQGLKESQDFAYELPSGQNYLVCKDTQNGVVKDLKINGKSLFNLCGKLQLSTDSSKVMAITDKSLKYMQNGKLITLINNTGKKVVYDIFANETDKWVRSEIIRVGEQNKTLKLDVNEYVGVVWGNKTEGWTDSDTTILKNTCILLEGDHTQSAPSYFEGIASVGNGNEIEVLSLNQTINYKDKYDSNVDGSYYFYQNGTKYDVSNMSSYNFKNNNYGVIKIVGKYTSHITFFNGNSFISGKLLEPPLFDEIIKVPSNCTEIRVGCRNDLVVPNIYLKQDKKPILFKDTDGAWKPVTELRGIDLNSCDTIEQHSDGKHYLHVRTEKLVLNGGSNENWVKSSSERPNHCIFVLNSVNVKLYSKCLSSRFNYDKAIWEKDIQGVTVGDKRLDYFVPNTINTVELWKQNLQQNNETVIILRDKELVYEVNPLDLQSFENETMISIGSGVVSAPTSFKITSSLPNTINNIVKRQSRIENEVFNTFTTIFKSMFNGNLDQVAYMLYPEDFEDNPDEGIMTIPEVMKSFK